MPGCGKCSSYSRSLGRCVQGKINPATVKGGADAAQLFGIGYICTVNGTRTRVIKELARRQAS